MQRNFQSLSTLGLTCIIMGTWLGMIAAAPFMLLNGGRAVGAVDHLACPRNSRTDIGVGIHLDVYHHLDLPDTCHRLHCRDVFHGTNECRTIPLGV